MLITPDSEFVANVAGLEFVGRRFDYTPGYYLTGVEGLLLGGEVGYEQIASGTGDGDGEHDVPNTRTGPRIITLTGFVYARDLRHLGLALNRLSGALASREDADWFTWEEFGQKYRAWVRRGRNGAARRLGTTGRTEFTIRFRAPSQRIYGDLNPRSGPGTTITLVNRGSFPALPTFEVTGNMPSGYRLTSGGVDYIVTQGLAPGQTDRINMRDRVLVRNGVAVGGAVSRPGRIEVPPTGQLVTVRLLPSSGAGQLVGQNYDEYI